VARLCILLAALVPVGAMAASDTPTLMFEVKSGDRFGLEAPEGTQKVKVGEKVGVQLFVTLPIMTLPKGYEAVPAAKLASNDLTWASEWITNAELAAGQQPIEAAVNKLIRSTDPGDTAAQVLRWIDAQQSGDLMLAYAQDGPGFITTREWLQTQESIRGMEVLTQDAKVATSLADAAPRWRFRVVQGWHESDKALPDAQRARTALGIVDLRWSVKVTLDPLKTDVDLGVLKVSYNAKKLAVQNEQAAGNGMEQADLALSFIGLGGLLSEAAAAAAKEPGFDIVSGFVVPNDSPKMFYGVQFRPDPKNEKALGVLAGHTAESEGQWVAALTAPIGDRGMFFAGGAFSDGGGETRTSACFGIGLRIDDLLLGAIGKKEKPAEAKEVEANVKVADTRAPGPGYGPASVVEDRTALVVVVNETGAPDDQYYEVTPKTELLPGASAPAPGFQQATHARNAVAFPLKDQKVVSVTVSVGEDGNDQIEFDRNPAAPVTGGAYQGTAKMTLDGQDVNGAWSNTTPRPGQLYQLTITLTKP